MNASGTWRARVAVAIDPESYHVHEDAAGRAYAFQMDDDTQDTLEDLVRRELPARARGDVHVEPGAIMVDVEPDLRTPLREFRDALADGVCEYNNRHADHRGEDLQIDTTTTYVGVRRPEDADALPVFVDGIDREEYAEKRGFQSADDPVFTWERDDPRKNAAGGPGRHVAFEVVVQVDPDTYSAPGGMAKPSDTFRWIPESEDVRDPVEYMEKPTRADRLLGQWGACMNVELWPTYARVRVVTGATVTTPQGVARQARRHLTALTPTAVAFMKNGRVLPLDPEDGNGIEAWLARETPQGVDGTPIQPDPEPEDQEENSGGGLLSWRT